MTDRIQTSTPSELPGGTKTTGFNVYAGTGSLHVTQFTSEDYPQRVAVDIHPKGDEITAQWMSGFSGEPFVAVKLTPDMTLYLTPQQNLQLLDALTDARAKELA